MPDGDTVYCIECGASTNATASFCRSCGAEQVEQQGAGRATSNADRVGGRRKLIVAAVALVGSLVVAGATTALLVGAGDSGSSSEPGPPQASPASPGVVTPDGSGIQGPLDFQGLAPIAVGMSPQEAVDSIGYQLEPRNSNLGGCAQIPITDRKDRYGGPAASIMVIGNEDSPPNGLPLDAEVVRVTITGTDYETESGLGLGDPEAAVLNEYGDAVEVTDHAYTQGGHYLTVSSNEPGQEDLRLVFETDEQGVVTIMHAGRDPYVAYVEGCA